MAKKAADRKAAAAAVAEKAADARKAAAAKKERKRRRKKEGIAGERTPSEHVVAAKAPVDMKATTANTPKPPLRLLKSTGQRELSMVIRQQIL